MTARYRCLFFVLLSFLFLFSYPTDGLASGGYAYEAGFDEISYLAAKYESLGNPGTAGRNMNYGNDRGNACGKYQFDQRYELGPFVTWCYQKDPAMYAGFAPYTGVPNNGRNHPILKSDGFCAVWRQIYAAYPEQFEKDQDLFAETTVLNPALDRLTRHYGYDFNHASEALKGCVLSFANRDGAYIQSLHRYFDGTVPTSTEEEIISRAYGRMMRRRPGERRWKLEYQDCLALKSKTIDIYARSENAAGGIDWNYKRAALELRQELAAKEAADQKAEEERTVEEGPGREMVGPGITQEKQAS